jgi:hypothetical protein
VLPGYQGADVPDGLVLQAFPDILADCHFLLEALEGAEAVCLLLLGHDDVLDSQKFFHVPEVFEELWAVPALSLGFPVEESELGTFDVDASGLVGLIEKGT